MQFTNVQEACDYAVRKMVEQGGQCKVQTTCVYGNEAGRHCAVGWLLPEDSPDNIWNFVGNVEDLAGKHGDSLPDVITENLYLMCHLQNFHDAESWMAREKYKRLLTREGINTKGEHWQQWVDMGK